MGTTVSNLQILGAPLEDVRTALPHTLVGQWSERFVTACPEELYFQHLDRKAGTLSKKLDCTILSVSMFDGDTLSLAVYQGGKRLTRHTVDPETGTNSVGNPKLFCSALGLSEELAPKLKRLFSENILQEEKLDILQALLGAPLFVRYGDEEAGYLPKEPVKEDSGPLEAWAKEHPEPPKIKNQCKAELIQEITDLCYSGYPGGKKFLFRPLLHVYDESEEERQWLKKMGRKDDDVLGVGLSGGKLGRLLPDGQLELTDLEDPSISPALIEYLFGDLKREVIFQHFSYAAQNDRLVTAATFFAEDGFHSYSPFQTVVLRDSAGILPCYLPLEAEGKPVLADELYLMPDGGFLACSKPGYGSFYNLIERPWGCITRYGPEGMAKYTVESEADLSAEDLAGLSAAREDQRQISSGYRVTDRQGCLWMYTEKYVECYSPDNTLISRHRLPGDVTALYCNDDGQVCAITFHGKTYTIRIYRFI